MKISRKSIAAIVLSASSLVGLVTYEGYKDTAYTPVAGDKLTLGFGTTQGVKLGDKTTPTVALGRALQDINKFEGAIKQCVTVPLAQNEYDAYISLSYNIGSGAFCKSTLVKKLNQKDYIGACTAILAWNKFQGKPLKGLTIRRQAEYKQCMGEQ